MKKSKKLRRKYFLRDSSQPILILRTYVVVLFVIIVSGTIFYFIGNKSLANEYYQAHSTIKTTMELLLPYLFIVNIVGLLGSFVLVIMFTHAIAGPIYQLKRLGKRIVEGDLTGMVKFRQRDLIQELAVIINQIIKALNNRFKQFRAPIEKSKEILSKIEDLEKLSDSELTALKKELLAIHQDLQQQMGQMKL